MGPKNSSTLSDPGSVNSGRPRRGRPAAVSREALLAVAEALFARSEAPQGVVMADIAAAAGVGKATVFRLFGSRVDLLNALFDARLEPLMRSYETARAELGEDAGPVELAVMFMDRLLDFKLANAHLMRAREGDDAPVYEVGFYRAIHGLLADLFAQAQPQTSKEQAAYRMHVLLGALQIDLLDELLRRQQVPLSQVRSAQADLVHATFSLPSSRG
jgi:AcrR family transcriptional regulator